MTPISPAPKPKPAAPKKRTWSSIKPKSHAEKLIAARTLRSSSGALKKKAKKRDRNDPARIYGPKAFRDFLRAEHCLGCCRRLNIQQAHRFSGGTGRKDGWQDTIPLCGPRPLDAGFYRGCHRSYDGAKQTWSREHNLPARAEHFWNRWLLHCGREGLDPQTGKKSGRLGQGGAE